MGKVDCVMGVCQESYNKGAFQKAVEVACNLLRRGDLSFETIAECTELTLEKIIELNDGNF